MRDVTFTEAVGALVKAVRGKTTQMELAERSGVVQSTISAIEVGNRKFASDHIEDILAATNIGGMAAIRLLVREAERLQNTPAPPPTKPGDVTRGLSGLAKGERPAKKSRGAKRRPSQPDQPGPGRPSGSR